VQVPHDVVHTLSRADGEAVILSSGFGAYLRDENPGFDQHDQPPGGGADPAAVLVCTTP